MTPKHPFFQVPWDERSDQPHRIKDRSLRRSLRRLAWGDYMSAACSALLGLPAWLTAYALTGVRGLGAAREHIGVAVSPVADATALQEAIAELGVDKLQLRCPVWAGSEQEAALALLATYPQYDWLLVVPQDRRAVCRPDAFARALDALLTRLPVQVEAVQLGNAVNRLKWGCIHLGEYICLLEAAMPVLQQHPQRRYAGSAVIDFEPLATWRSLVNRGAFHLDICSALLYVDRRGPPEATQMGLFDTRRKLRTVAAALRCSRRCARELWITEVNWPLAGHGADAPTSGKEAVDEQTAADYLDRYLRLVLDTGYAQRAYVWQLVAKGYGLIDPSDWRRRPAYQALQRLLQER